MKPSYGVIVGRFQVNDLHDGHMELFRQVRSRHNGVIVFVGQSPAGLTQDNPLDFQTRKSMIQAKFPEFTVLPLMDTNSDKSWSDQLDNEIAKVVDFGAVTLYGGRESFVPHYAGRHTPVELALPIETQHISGTQIRKQFSNTVIESPEFRAGMIYAAHHLWPVMLMMVDVAILSYDRSEICLGRRENSTKWRFIGGHVESAKLTLEGNARAEALEEAGADTIDMKYIGSTVINDWRYNQSDRSVVTAFFAGRVSSMSIKAGDDIHEVRWFKIDKLSMSDLVETHHPLFLMLTVYLAKEASANAGTAKA